jgi:hypothetical protein
LSYREVKPVLRVIYPILRLLLLWFTKSGEHWAEKMYPAPHCLGTKREEGNMTALDNRFRVVTSSLTFHNFVGTQQCPDSLQTEFKN